MYEKSKIVKITSMFPASKKEVFGLLQEFKMLSQIAYPYITFTPINDDENFLWKEGETFVFRVKLLGYIPFGIHKINVIEFKENTRIYTNEQNTYVPVWNHEIVLKELGKQKTKYTDIVEIYAGWRTYFVYLWAKLFYAHRQRKWIRIINNLNGK